MREVKPTQKPVPSSDIKDLFFNSGLLDIWATSLEPKYIDRFGNCHLTAAGMEWLFKELVETFKVDMNTAIVAAGYITIDSFQQGADLPNNELTQRNHILRDETTGEYYRWDGDLPKQVPAGSTPQSTGGIGKGAWVSVGDASLRSDIRSIDGQSYVGSTNYQGIRSYTGTNGRIGVYGRDNIFDGAQGSFFLDSNDATSDDNDCTVLIDALGRRWRRDFSSGRINVLWAGVGYSGADNTLNLKNAILAAGKRGTIYLPTGINCGVTSGIDLSDTFCSIIGDGPEVSKITCLPSFDGTLITQSNTTSDGGDTFERIDGVGIYGNYNESTIGIYQKLTSRSTISNVLAQGFGTGIKQLDNFVHLMQQVEIKDCKINLHLVGSNHNSEYVRVGIVGFGDSFGRVGTGIKIENLGNDNLQSSIAFRGCDIEFGYGDGVDIDCTGTVTFDNCYMEKVRSSMFIIRRGNVIVSGGEYIIHDATGFFVDPVGANSSIHFTNKVSIASDGITRIYPCLIKNGGAGKVYFESTTLYETMLTTNNGTLPDNVGKLGLYSPIIKTQGRHFGANAFTGALTQVNDGDAKAVTCTSNGGIGVYQQLQNQPSLNERSVLVIRYASNVSASVTLCKAAGQAAPIQSLGGINNTNGEIKVMILPNAKMTDVQQQFLEFWRGAGWVSGDYIKIYSAYWLPDGSISHGRLTLY